MHSVPTVHQPDGQADGEPGRKPQPDRCGRGAPIHMPRASLEIGAPLSQMQGIGCMFINVLFNGIAFASDAFLDICGRSVLRTGK